MALSKITTNSITDDAVTNAKVADDAVNTAQIANDAVTTAKVNPAQTDITSVGTLTSLAVDGAVTINESGAAVDFRVEGDTKDNLLLVDGSADKVGINTSSPDALNDGSGTNSSGEIQFTFIYKV